jgi:transcription initiation factor TFIIB
MDVEIPPMDPHDFLPRATSLLAAPQQVERCAEQLLDAQTEDESESRSFSPRTLAAAALHAAYDLINCADRPPLSELSEVLDVSVSTISERKEVLLQYRKAIR